MKWRKLGRIFCGAGQRPWMMTHASQPFAEQVDDDVFRAYFTTRDARNRSHVGWLDFDIRRPDRALRLAEIPLLEPGPEGSFDDAGTMFSSLVTCDGRRYLYYTAWTLRRTVPYHLAIGLAIGLSGSGPPSVERIPGPIIERSPTDPLYCASPFVRLYDGAWSMWYVSGLPWVKTESGFVPSYNLRYADSSDGIDWHRGGSVVLQPRAGEYGFSRPSIERDEDGWHLWYSVRGRDEPYRLASATSAAGVRWQREDAAETLIRSASGWDAEMICYPHVFRHRDARYMLYSGNGYGASGFGLAKAE